MQNFRSQLPNLDSLIAFEAAARLESFTLAAEALYPIQSLLRWMSGISILNRC